MRDAERRQRTALRLVTQRAGEAIEQVRSDHAKPRSGPSALDRQTVELDINQLVQTARKLAGHEPRSASLAQMLSYVEHLAEAAHVFWDVIWELEEDYNSSLARDAEVLDRALSTLQVLRSDVAGRGTETLSASDNLGAFRDSGLGGRIGVSAADESLEGSSEGRSGTTPDPSLHTPGVPLDAAESDVVPLIEAVSSEGAPTRTVSESSGNVDAGDPSPEKARAPSDDAASQAVPSPSDRAAPEVKMFRTSERPFVERVFESVVTAKQYSARAVAHAREILHEQQLLSVDGGGLPELGDVSRLRSQAVRRPLPALAVLDEVDEILQAYRESLALRRTTS